MTVGMLAWTFAAGAAVTGAAWAVSRLAAGLGVQERWLWVAALVLAAGAAWVPVIPQQDAPRGEIVEFRAIEVPPGESVDVAAGPGSTDRFGDRVETLANTKIPGFGAAWLGFGTLLLCAMLGMEIVHRRRCTRMPTTTVWGFPARLDERHGPAVTGVLRPTLILQDRALALDRAKRRALVTHELEHLRAGDVRLLAFAYLVVALAPWTPWTWILARRVALAAEADCDRRTLIRRETSPRDYVDLLLEVARWRTRPPAPVVQLAMGRDARRLMSRLDSVLPDRGPGRVVPALLLLTAVLAVSPALADPPRVVVAASDVVTDAGEPAGRYAWIVTERADTLDTIRATATFRAAEVPPADSVPTAAGVIRPLRPTDAGLRVRLRALADGPDIDGSGAFTVRLNAAGRPEDVETEIASGPAFETRALEWLGEGEYEADDGVLHVWVAARAGRWSATPVSDDLYARRSLGSDPAELRSLVDTWAELQQAAVPGLPRATATFVPDSSGGGR